MSCSFCASGNLAKLAAEINIHLLGLKNLDKPSVLIFPMLLVCLDCGFSQFTVPDAKLGLLATGLDSDNGGEQAILNFESTLRGVRYAACGVQKKESGAHSKTTAND
jgi:hypothetical protein